MIGHAGQRPLVLILGAGLSGLTLANLLDPARLDVLVLQQDFPPGRPGIFHGIVTTGDLEELGLSPAALPGAPISNAVGIASMARIPVEGWHAVKHGALLGALRERAIARGVRMVANREEVDLIWRQGDLGGVRIRGTGQAFEADVLAFADESDPRLPEQLGLRPDWLPTELVHSAKVRFEGGPGQDDWVIADSRAASWGSEGFVQVIPGDGAVTVRVGMLLEEEMATARHISEYLEEILRTDRIAKVVAGLTRGSMVTDIVPVGGFDRRRPFSRERAMVVNDLVGVTHPLNRDGMSTTIALGKVAANVIHAAISGNVLDSRQLGRYSDELWERFGREARSRSRRSRSLAGRPPWQWFSLPELVPRTGVTPIRNSAKLPAGPVSAVRRRVNVLVGRSRSRT